MKPLHSSIASAVAVLLGIAAAPQMAAQELAVTRVVETRIHAGGGRAGRMIARGADDEVGQATSDRGLRWDLVWSDEFDTPGLPDSAKWTYETGGNGWGNRELQFYTNGRPENARVENGLLIVEARREDFQGRPYTSARLNSRAAWLYSRIEVRAKLPRGRGTWPAIWMLPVRGVYAKGGWPDNGEIDVMEHVGFDPGVVHATVHTGAYNHVQRTQRGAETIVADAQDVFHV